MKHQLEAKHQIVCFRFLITAILKHQDSLILQFLKSFLIQLDREIKLTQIANLLGQSQFSPTLLRIMRTTKLVIRKASSFFV